MTIRRLLLVAVVLGVMPGAAADDTAWPGGIAMIDLGAVAGAPPVVTYKDRRVLVMNHDGRWHAVVGVPLDSAVGEASIILADGSIKS